MPEQVTRRSQTLQYVVLGLVLLQMVAMVVFAYARLGNFRHMPDPLQRLALMVRNPSVPRMVPLAWVNLCIAWDSWLPFLQKEAPRLLRTEALLTPNDPLRAEIADFLANADALRPAVLVPAAAAEMNLRVLAESPSDAVLNELMMTNVQERVSRADARIRMLSVKLEKWPRWEELRTLLTLLRDHGFNQTARALEPRLPLKSGSPGHRANTVRTLKCLNDLSRDSTGLLAVMNRWSEFTRLAAERKGTGNADKAASSELLFGRLTDRPTLAEFADSMAGPLEELRSRR